MNIHVLPDSQSYRVFVEEAWLTEVLKQTENTPFDNAAVELCAAVKAVAYARNQPLAMLENLEYELREVALERMFIEDGPIQNALSPLRIFAESVRQQIVFNRAVDQVAANLRNLVSQPLSHPVLDIHGLFRHLATENERFQMVLWKSEHQAFVSLFFAYEFFLNRVYFGLTGKTTRREFGEALSKAVGDSVANFCWREIQVQRRLRDAIVHNGGRKTKELEELRARGAEIRVNGEGYLILTAEDVNELYFMLKPRVLKLLTTAVKMPPAFAVGPDGTTGHGQCSDPSQD